jgi:hypothetical protein
MVKLAVKPADGQYGASNDIKEYAATKGAAPAAAASGEHVYATLEAIVLLSDGVAFAAPFHE